MEVVGHSLSDGSNARPPSCLIVEDAALIGLALEGYLEDRGYLCATVTSSDEGLAFLDEHTPSVAIIDYLLKDGPCVALLSALRARGIPFLIYSGYPDSTASPEFGGAVWINKPASRDTLLGAVAKLVANDSQRGASVGNRYAR